MCTNPARPPPRDQVIWPTFGRDQVIWSTRLSGPLLQNCGRGNLVLTVGFPGNLVHFFFANPGNLTPLCAKPGNLVHFREFNHDGKTTEETNGSHWPRWENNRRDAGKTTEEQTEEQPTEEIGPGGKPTQEQPTEEIGPGGKPTEEQPTEEIGPGGKPTEEQPTRLAPVGFEPTPLARLEP